MDTFTARTPVDLLAIVPYVLGFHPEDSVVLLTLGAPGPEDGSPGPGSFHARVDLPLEEAGQREVSRMLREVVGRHGATVVGIVLYTDDSAAAVHLTGLLHAGFESDGVTVVDVLRVDEDRYYAAEDPDDPGVGYDLDAHPFTAQQVVDGRVVHPTRSALRESLVGADPEDAAALDARATAFVDELVTAGRAGSGLGPVLAGHATWLHQRLEQAHQDRLPLDVADASQVLVLVSFDALREVAWAVMTRSDSRALLELWRPLVRRAPVGLRAGAGGLLAFAAWLAGDGALAWCAIDRALEDDPDDRLAHHVAALLEAAVPPHAWEPTPLSSLRIFTAFGAAAAG